MILEKYKLMFSGRTQAEISFRLSPVSGTKNALHPVGRKLYIVKYGERILYIGEANCSLDTRFRRGFTSYRYFIRNGKKRNGYQGYKWIKLSDANTRPELDIHVAVFDEKYNEIREFVEAVEGELVHLVRAASNQWPEYQNEIHFNNEAGAKEIAADIFMQLMH